MAKLSTLGDILEPIVTSLGEVAVQLDKAKTEIITSLGDVEIPEAAMVKLNALGGAADALKSLGKQLDDINPDAPAPPAP